MRSIHAGQGHLGWDRNIEPVLVVDAGDEVEVEALDASGGQLGPTCTTTAAARPAR